MIKSVKIDRAQAGEDPTHDPNVDRSYYFAGNVNVQGLVVPDEGSGVEILAVFLEASARTRPHIHELDQILHFIEGHGIVATATEKYYAMPGDIFTIPAGTWHWHGAARDASTCYISIRQPSQTTWDVEEGNWAAGYDD